MALLWCRNHKVSYKNRIKVLRSYKLLIRDRIKTCGQAFIEHCVQWIDIDCHYSQRSDYPVTKKGCFEPRSERMRSGVWWLLSDTDLFIRHGALDQLAELIALYFGDSTSVSTWVALVCVVNASVERMYTHPVEDTQLIVHTHTHPKHAKHTCQLLLVFCFLFDIFISRHAFGSLYCFLRFVFVKPTQGPESTPNHKTL